MYGKKLLPDTHALLWFLDNSRRIPKSVMTEIQKPDNQIFFAQLSLLEIAIKQAIGKMPDFQSSTDEVYEQAVHAGFGFVTLQNAHLLEYGKIPVFDAHRDPFDRLLIATAVYEKFSVVTVDKNFLLYKDIVKTIWSKL